MKVRRRRIKIENTPLGRGVFAAQRLRQDQIIGEVKGKVIADPDYAGSTYAIDLGEGKTLEPSAPFRFLNHSCQPNAELIISDADDEIADGEPLRTWVRALASIEPGEELTIDYAWPADAAIPCGCRSQECRGWVVDANALADVVARQTKTS